jgi:hypothetical protein
LRRRFPFPTQEKAALVDVSFYQLLPTFLEHFLHVGALGWRVEDQHKVYVFTKQVSGVFAVQLGSQLQEGSLVYQLYSVFSDHFDE